MVFTAKLEMKKIEIAALLKDSKRMIERLQRRGVVELQNIEDENLMKLNTAASISQFEKARSTAVSALTVLNRYCPKKSALKDLTFSRRAVEKHEFGKTAEKIDQYMNTAYRINALERKIGESLTDISKCKVRMDSLKPWLALDIPQNFGGTRSTACFIGTVRGFYTADTLKADFHDRAVFEVIHAEKDRTELAVFCHRTAADEVLKNLRENYDFTAVSDPTSVTPDEETKALAEKAAALNRQMEDCRKELQSFCGSRENLEFAADYFAMRKEKYEAIKKLGVTNKTFILTGFIPAKYADKLLKELESRFTVAVRIYDPDDDEDVPVLLQNSRFSEPVEGITEMYALPNKHDIDPTGVMAFFYYLFFGMMLSDAGYGLLMIIGTTVALHNFQFEYKMRRTLKMFQYCGISTVFWGALFGSWFGDIIPVVANNFFGANMSASDLSLWFNPIDDPMRLLLFSFILGIAHLFLGLGTNFYILWRDGKRMDAVCDVIPIMLTVLGAAPLAGNILSPVPQWATTVGKYMAVVGVIAIVLTAGRSSKNIFMRFFGGIYGLYNTATGYLSDILSYSRLLALGLATGQIASVINLIGTMPQNPVAKAILLIVVFLVGHTANLAINLLGAYVHTDRLQFVELFSKFYEGGGRAFEPLGVHTDYIKFKEEN